MIGCIAMRLYTLSALHFPLLGFRVKLNIPTAFAFIGKDAAKFFIVDRFPVDIVKKISFLHLFGMGGIQPSFSQFARTLGTIFYI
jgi:hypothetical protein